ncbi:MAG: FixH family protein [Flavobacteriales bacterium]|jgi:hypothetical protein|nr:FixH family protein [Flavobacteriales bacterium]MBK6550139.1 FixH family protein [Flavobacteriales bacterium]MBK6881700.1 FixH family protein [Flavobacteriales bacterium]MBK7102649.1 FixH family protein [Flavobacteriales bacterium]MBK7113383.1 FixH family protein [Flavobacteriales bacterium]
MNWGKGLALALIAFAGMMTWFVVMASRNPSPLVTEEYYEKELKFQERIDHTERANALSSPVRIAVTAQDLRLEFPEEFHGKVITGELTLLRPNDPRADQVITVNTTGIFERGNMELWPGRYNASLEWTVDGTRYFTEEKLVVP